MEICIIIPSHINNVNRTKLLINCLESLINQTLKKDIYLSISFETSLDKILFDKLLSNTNYLNNELINIIYQENKTSQFRHIDKLLDNLKLKYKYVMFCDDDDTYDLRRVEIFNELISNGINLNPKDKIFVGAYERDGDSHINIFHEYWSYCLDINFIINFMNILKINNYDSYIDNVMCDVVFSTYLRCLDNKHSFVSTYQKLYNYNRNDYSITQKIVNTNKKKKNMIQIKVNDFEEFMNELNKMIEENMEDIKNNILVTYFTRKITFENALKELLKENYIYKDKIDKNIFEKIKYEYNNTKSLFDLLNQWK